MPHKFRTASIYGLGYVGLPSACVFADSGLDIIGVDVNAQTVASINDGKPHIVEPDLDVLLARVVSAGKLRATIEPTKADVYIIAVPTPFKENKRPDLAYVEAATRMIAPLLEKGNLVILESTSPVGTTEKIAGWIAEDRADLIMPVLDGKPGDIFLAHCPERILPGKVIHEVVHNDRIIGGLTPACSDAAVAFYKISVKGACHVTNARTAELCKLSENAFRDVNIAFANEMSLICDRMNVDVWELIALTNRHPRVEILRPGPGVGGHCIAVDPWFIVDGAPDEARLITTARQINDYKPQWVVSQIEALKKDNPAATIGCFGLAYKPDVDDLRESPSVEIVAALARNGHAVLVCEPFITERELPARLRMPNIALVEKERAHSADILVFLTNHSQFADYFRANPPIKPHMDSCGMLR